MTSEWCPPVRKTLIAGAAAFASATSVLASDCDGLIAKYNALGVQYNKAVELRKAAREDVAKSCGHLEMMRSINDEMIDARQKLAKCKVKGSAGTVADLQTTSAALRSVIGNQCASRSGACSKRVIDLLKVWTEKFGALGKFDYDKASKTEACAQRKAIDSTAIGAMGEVSNLRTECADYLSGADEGSKSANTIMSVIADMAVNARTLKEITSAGCS